MKSINAFLPSLLGMILIPVIAFSQEGRDTGGKSHSQSGMVDLNMQEKSKNPYKEGQRQAIDFIKNLIAKTNDLKSGKESKIDVPSDAAIHYLTGVYLYCTITKATCPELLDLIYETDLINSKISKGAECPSMLKFWHDWQNNDMENRQRFLLRVGNFAATSSFSANKRPRYIKCKESIGEELKSQKSNTEYFRERYGEGTESKASSFQKALEYTEALEKNIPDVFQALNQMK